MLVLRPQNEKEIVLTDTEHGTKIIIKSFVRQNGDWMLGFDAPQTVRITRERNEPEES